MKKAWIWKKNLFGQLNPSLLNKKFETLITRGVTNTRMRDLYDIHILTTTQQLDSYKFRSALKKTMEK